MAIGPESTPSWIGDAVELGGAAVVEPGEANVLLWSAPDDPAGLRAILAEHGDHIVWVQLPWAGIEPYVDIVDDVRIWTCGKGVYAEPVAEMALTLALAGLRGLGRYARSDSWRQHGFQGVNLRRARVTVLGGGGITEAFLRLLGPFGTHTTVVRRNPAPLAGAQRVVGFEAVDEAITEADLVVLALALTDETRGVIDRRRLGLLHPESWVVNVARGQHIVTDDLVDALTKGAIGGAGLDVTDPEPLPDDHPLWRAPELHHHPARRQHPRHGAAPAGRADHRQHAPVEHRGRPPRPRRPAPGLLTGHRVLVPHALASDDTRCS